MIHHTIDPGMVFVSLAFAIESHTPGYIDSCFLSSDQDNLRDVASNNSLSDILAKCDHLLSILENSWEMNEQRRAFLCAQTRAMRTRAELLQSPTLDQSIASEAEALFDAVPTWTPESQFDEQRKLISNMLPRDAAPLRERLKNFRASGRVLIDSNRPLVSKILETLRERSRSLFQMPSSDRVDVTLSDEIVARAYHRYHGNLQSSVEISRSVSLDVSELISLLAHEVFPGHHLELVCKESKLVEGLGWHEHSLTINDAPSCTISEGIACCGLAEIFSSTELITWTAELMEALGQDPGEAEARVSLEQAMQELRAVQANAILLHDDGKSEQQIVNYLEHYALCSAEEARRRIRFIRVVRGHACTYSEGTTLVRDYLNRSEDRINAFSRLLHEPMLPSQLRANTSKIDNKYDLTGRATTSPNN